MNNTSRVKLTGQPFILPVELQEERLVMIDEVEQLIGAQREIRIDRDLLEMFSTTLSILHDA